MLFRSHLRQGLAIAVLCAGVAAPAEEAPKATIPEISGSPGKGLTVKVGDRFSLNVRSRIQTRYALTSLAATSNTDRDLQQLVNINTLRLYFAGNVLRSDLTYLIQLALAPRDYRDGSISPVYDAFIDWAPTRDANVRVGQYFVPFDRLRTIRESALQLPERARPVAEFTLDRDVGITLYSNRFLSDRSPFAYKLGLFGGNGPNVLIGKEPGLLLVGRLELRPLAPIDDDIEGDLERRPKPALALGVAAARNWNSNRLRSTTGPTFVGGTVDYNNFAADLVFKWIGIAVEAEYLWKRASTDAIVGTGPTGAPLVQPTRAGRGWVLQGSYVFPKPIEVVGRVSRMYAEPGTDPSFITELRTKEHEWAAGLNYYVNGHAFKVQAAWIARTTSAFNFHGAEHQAIAQVDATF